jgi:hypothetical protein
VGLGNKPQQLTLQATGRQVPVHVVNKITGQNVAGADIKAADTDAQTDKNGEVTLVLPADQRKVAATIRAKSFNDQPVEVTINASNIQANTFGMVPAGKLYFLSKKYGKLDVVKTDLDGGNRQVALAGTGNEDAANTVLLATRDWRYLALLARRDGTRATLYMIDTNDDKLTEMDSGDVNFNLVGWSEHNFVYLTSRNNVQPWQPKSGALKGFNADTKQVTTLDETQAEGGSQNDYATEALGTVFLLKDSVFYTKRRLASYYSVYYLADKQMGIYTVKAGGGNKQTIKQFSAGSNGYINVALVKPNDLYLGVYNALTSFYEYKDGKLVESKSVTDDSVDKAYPAYVLSPSGNVVLWQDKGTIYIGNSQAETAKQFATETGLMPYGWYGDDYILLSRGGSQLYIQSSSGLSTQSKLVLISDYSKPNYASSGYVTSYGGL